MSVPTFDQSPLELPGKDCLKPEMRLEYQRIVSFALLLTSNIPSGVFVLNLAKNLYFFTRNSRIICFYCGFHYVLGHSETCRGNWCNVPFNKCWDLMEQERRCCEAVEESIQLGRMTLRVSVAAHRPQFEAQFHPDDAGRRTSADMPVSRFRSHDQSLVAAGFYPVRADAVKCCFCHALITLDNLVPLREQSGLHYILRRHAQVSPRCKFNPH